MLTIEVDQICFVDKFWPSEGKDINKYENGSSIERPRQPSQKIDRTSNNGGEVKIETEYSDGLKTFYMCHFATGLTHCYKTTVFFYIYLCSNGDISNS